MFRSISARYDRANTILSAGVHHRWRTQAVRWSGARPGDSVLDCATGTGDLAIAFRKAVGAGGRVAGTDFVPEMIELAQRKAPEITFEVADVTALPYEDASFDVASLGKKGDLGDTAFHSAVRDPYLNNPIARASVTMAELSALRIAPVAMAAE